MKIFVLNPGSSSLKAALFEDDRMLFSVTKRHDPKVLAGYKNVVDQLDFRMGVIDEIIAENNIDFAEIDAIAARGGFCKPVSGGTFTINDRLLADLHDASFGEHAANLSPMCAEILSRRYGIPAFFTDPVSVDEFMPESYVTGVPGVRRISKFHALNHRAAAHMACEKLGKPYSEANLVVAHMGGGITIGAHKKGRVVDATNPSEEGPMCIDRPGTMPNLRLIEYIFDNGLSREEATRRLSVSSGFMAYMGLTDLIEIERAAETDAQAALLLDTMCYRTAYYICALSAAFGEKTDAVVLTGGMAKSDWVVPKITERVRHIAPVFVFPGEKEMEALAAGAERVLLGQEEVQEY